MKTPRMQNFLEGGLSSRPPISTRVFEFKPVRADHRESPWIFLLRRCSGAESPNRSHLLVSVGFFLQVRILRPRARNKISFRCTPRLQSFTCKNTTSRLRWDPDGSLH